MVQHIGDAPGSAGEGHETLRYEEGRDVEGEREEREREMM